MENWKKFNPGGGRPTEAKKVVDVQYIDGKIFRNKPVENCYWGSKTLIAFWRNS